MKPKALFYLQTVLSFILICTLLILYPQNVKYKRENSKLILENDSILSVNQMLHQRLDMEAASINNK